MQRKSIYVLVGLIFGCVVVAPFALRACQLAEPKEGTGFLKSDEVRAITQRHELIGALIGRIGSSKERKLTPDQVGAMYMLGDFRATEAVPKLLPYLTFESDFNPAEGFVEPYEYFPAALAVVKIQGPAVGELRRVARNSARIKSEREIATWALLRIESSQQGAGFLPSSREVKDVVSAHFHPLPADQSSVPLAFIGSYCMVDGPWSELPIVSADSLPVAQVGKRYQFQAIAKAPAKHPEAKITFELGCDDGDDIACKEFTMSESGKLEGIPSRFGVYRFSIWATATNDKEVRSAGRNVSLVVNRND